MKRSLLIASVIILFSPVLSAQDAWKPMEWKGYVKDLQGVNVYGQFDSSSFSNLIHNRIILKADISKRLSGRLEVRNRIYTGSFIHKTPGFSQGLDPYPELLDLSILWIDDPSLVFHSVIDRLLLSYSMEKWDVTIGRQRINWGMNTVWNPNDIFNAYNFLDFDYEERPGNDALRIRYHPKENSSIEWAWKPGKEKDQHIASFLYRFNRDKYDLQFLGGVCLSDIVVGAGWAGSIGEKGFKGELSYFHPATHPFDTMGVLSASLMMDHTLKNGWYLSASLLYNSHPAGFSGDAGIFSSDLSAKSLFPFRYSFYTGVVKNIATLFNLTASIVYAPDHHSLIIFPSMSYNASEALDIDLTIQSFFASDQGRYALQGGALYLRGRWSF
jgi:hypothetical protein